MNIRKWIAGAVIAGTMTAAGLALAPVAGAADVVDFGQFVLNGCTINTAGIDDPSTYQTTVYAYNANSCGKPTCIREAAIYNGNLYWASQGNCTSGGFGEYSFGPTIGGTYFGREISVDGVCYWDTIYTDPAQHACA